MHKKLYVNRDKGRQNERREKEARRDRERGEKDKRESKRDEEGTMNSKLLW